jgi:Domain of unknown function (DUF4372)/Transposase DDE domain
MHYNTIMNQLQTFIPRHRFENLVSRYLGDRYVKIFNCWKQLTVMLYAQISGKDSLRDIVNAFLAQAGKLYHVGLDMVHRSTLAEANQKRDYRIYEGLFYALLERCKDITPMHKFKFKNPLFIFDATVIDLCLSMFSWAKFRTTKGAIKLHCQLDHAGQIPTFMVVTDAKKHEITVARSSFDIVPDSIYCMDKGYMDFAWFHSIDIQGAFFVTRAKDNINYTVTGQHPESSKKSVISDEIIALNGFYQKQDYPKELRLIHYYDKQTDKLLVFLTNNFKLAASTIAGIYKARWQVEVFFKWIKQNLKIKTFLGTSKNAVLTQVWIAMCYYLLLSYIKYQSKYKYSLFYLHKVIQETLLERLNLIDLLNLNDRLLPKIKNTDRQLTLAFAF